MTRTGLAIAFLAAFLAACSDNPANTTGPSALMAPAGDGSARVGMMSEADRAPLGSKGADCASDVPVVTQANQHGGLVDYVARYPYGTSKAEGEVWQRVGSGANESYRRFSQFFIGDGVMPFLSYTTEPKPEDGRYKYRTRRLKCGKAEAIGPWSEFKDFTIGGNDAAPYVPPVIEEEPEAEEPLIISDGPCNAGRGNGPEGCNPGNSGPGHDE